MNVTGILLAAGSSKRMGATNKMLQPLSSNCILEQSLENLAQANVDEILLVTGFEADKISDLPLVKKLQTEQKLTLVFNKNYELGMGTSIACAIKYLKQNSNAAIIALGDMPYVKPSTINQLIDEANKYQDKQIFIPQYAGKTGNPVLWKNSLFTELSKLDADTGGKHIIQAHQTLSHNVAVADKGVLKDIDTPDSYE